MIGWALAHAGRADRPTRFWCLAASMLPDLDGVGLVLGVNSWSYQNLHHLLGHNLLFGLVETAAASRWVGSRPGPLALVFAAFLAHLVGDYFGSGPGWALWPLWPFSNLEFIYERAWDLFSWQNSVIGAAALAVALWIAVRPGRTPLEFVSASAERVVVETLQRRFKTRGSS